MRKLEENSLKQKAVPEEYSATVLVFSSTIKKLRDDNNFKGSKPKYKLLEKLLNDSQNLILFEFYSNSGRDIIPGSDGQRWVIKIPKEDNSKFFDQNGQPEHFYNKKFPEYILKETTNTLNGLTLYKDTPNIDVKSAVDFFNIASMSDFCVYFNAKIEDERWFDTAMQFNLFIQQSAFLANNFRHIIKCYELKGEGLSCQLPSRKSLRIMFFPEKEKDIKTKLEDIKNPNLRNIFYTHIINGIPLAIIGIDKLIGIIDKIDLSRKELICLNIPKYYNDEINTPNNKLIYLSEQLFKNKNDRDRLDFSIFGKKLADNSYRFTDIWTGSIATGKLSYKPHYPFSKIEGSTNEDGQTMLDIGVKFYNQVIDNKKVEAYSKHPLLKIDPIKYIHDKTNLIDHTRYIKDNNNKEDMLSIKDEFCATRMLDFDY